MKNLWHLAKCVAVALLAVFAADSAFAQSTSGQAINWLNIGIRTKNLEKKIEAYNKAIALDSTFAKALYHLGMAYHQQQDYRRAEQFLLKAYNAQSDRFENELRLQILLALAETSKKLGKLENSEAALRSARNLAIENAIHAAIALELGWLLFEQGRYSEALAELQDGQKISSGKQREIANLIQAVESEIELQRLLETAEKARASGNLDEAKARLEQIAAKNAGYRNIKTKIAEVESLLNAKTREEALAAIYEQAQKHEAEGRLEIAIALYENLLQHVGDYHEVRSRLPKTRRQLLQNQLTQRLEIEYAAGMAALEARNWVHAIAAFDKVLNLDRNFRDARRRLGQAKRGLRREKRETILARYYADGIAAMNRNELDQALTNLEIVHKINPSYRDVAGRLSAIESARQQRAELTMAPASTVLPESLRQAVLVSQEKEDWRQSAATLEELRLLQPENRGLAGSLARARENPNMFPQSGAGTSFLRIVGAVVTGIALSFLGLLFFSPTTRASVYLWRHNYVAAAQIFEKLLARNPRRLRLYDPLARAYLHQGRRDERAMKVYKTILQLNLPTRHREEITAIVAQLYLTEGRTDSDVIEVLENALKMEQRKQGQLQSGGTDV
jgi:tetratricopeptide (TPR) repeat protein